MVRVATALPWVGAQVAALPIWNSCNFTPLVFITHTQKSNLITEAVRGEGGRLLLPNGTRFMEKFDPRGELAPRDIVARSIDHEMKRLGIDSVFLDISHKSESFLLDHFPNVYAMCRKFGYDMSKEPVPVVPAAHYTCGGLMVDDAGQTDLNGLYAIGETTFTGFAWRKSLWRVIHCSNVWFYGQSSSKDIAKRFDSISDSEYDIPDWDASRVTDSDERVVINHNWDEVRRFMWDYVGIVRTSKRLQRARNRIEMLLTEIDEYYSNFRITGDLIELRNLAEVARLIIRSAQKRQESRGLHYTLDYPDADPSLEKVNSILDPIKRSAFKETIPCNDFTI